MMHLNICSLIINCIIDVYKRQAMEIIGENKEKEDNNDNTENTKE